jgi:hypothetical protein
MSMTVSNGDSNSALDCLVVGMSLELEDHVHVRLIPRELAKNCTSES